jgi:hypothetical protein
MYTFKKYEIPHDESKSLKLRVDHTRKKLKRMYMKSNLRLENKI